MFLSIQCNKRLSDEIFLQNVNDKENSIYANILQINTGYMLKKTKNHRLLHQSLKNFVGYGFNIVDNIVLYFRFFCV